MYPNVKENLEQFRMHLKESAHEMAPLKVWQLQGTGICFTLLKTQYVDLKEDEELTMSYWFHLWV